jgi:hypothetical protein
MNVKYLNTIYKRIIVFKGKEIIILFKEKKKIKIKINNGK